MEQGPYLYMGTPFITGDKPRLLRYLTLTMPPSLPKGGIENGSSTNMALIGKETNLLLLIFLYHPGRNNVFSGPFI